MKKHYRILTSMAIGIVLLLTATVGVSALEYKSMSRHSGSSSAYASWTWPISDPGQPIVGSGYMNLEVNQTDDETRVSVNLSINMPDGTYMYGYGTLYTAADVFQVNGKLNSASLSAVTFDLYGYGWPTYPQTVTVSAEWTGSGDLYTQSSTQKWSVGDTSYKSTTDTSSRPATASGTITLPGVSLKVSQNAHLNSFTSSEMRMEK